MAEQHEDHHGSSTAAWALVGIVLLGSLIMSIAVAFPNVPLFIGGVVVVILGLVVGKVLALAGYGVDGQVARRDTNSA
ncbi:hypothetical protein BCF74_10568 [Knoellia remsis]|uniref:Uncharacterized protein n=1 Tax=Knoellia remsis TaxID=407159 RepID=A0A2T0UUB2_9MICO|nr:HGxxPAAW family protein [Knoellia remsis]PRY61511.1 hypothetical protein BCF74_10568 [Knoellia remsis]